MARLKNQRNCYIEIEERDYLTLIESHIVLQALKQAGIEKMGVFKSIKSIIDNDRVEIHLRPIKRRYR